MKDRIDKPGSQGQDNKIAEGKGRKGERLIDLEKSEVGGVRLQLYYLTLTNQNLRCPM